MRRYLLLLLSLAVLVSLAVSCRKEEVPSYVGTWVYVSSQPDLGPAYKDSYVRMEKNGSYEFFDGGTGSTFSGTSEDFTADGFKVTLKADNGTIEKTYISTLTYLKGGKMVVVTDSVNGVLTEIEFRKL